MLRDPHSLARRLALVVLTDGALARPRSVVEVVVEALRAGAPAIQLRNKGDSARALLEVGRTLRRLTREAGALLLVNDRIDVALTLDADGVHLGPDDVPVAAARRIVPDDFLIGRSADDPEVAAQAVRDGADYIGCGTVYPTSTKPDAGSVIGVDGLRRVARAVPVPVVGIGGITTERAPDVLATGACGVAVVGAIMAAADVEGEVRAFMKATL